MLTTIDVIFYAFYSGAFAVWAPPKNTVCDLGSHFESAPVKLLFSQMLVGGACPEPRGQAGFRPRVWSVQEPQTQAALSVAVSQPRLSQASPNKGT